MAYKLLLLDIDGTLTASKGNALPSSAVIEAVQLAQQHLTVAVATGRSRNLAQAVIDTLGIDSISIFNGGADTIDLETGENLRPLELGVNTLQELVRLGLPFGYELFTDQDNFGSVITSPESVTTTSPMLLIEGAPSSEAMAIISSLESVNDVIAHATSSWLDGDVVDIHVTHQLATKRHAAEFLMQRMAVTKEEVMAIGDGFNDMPLLEAVGLKVVMGNAPKEVKAIADWIAPDLENDGVAAAIQRFILS